MQRKRVTYYAYSGELYARPEPAPRSPAEAIAESIRKWRFLLDGAKRGRRVKNAGDHCALCSYYDGDCWRCPVFDLTERTECHGTPFVSYRAARSAREAAAAAEAEILFLRAVAVLNRGR